ncbi:unnamed protein product, partial [Rotaria sp. Silwood2]
KSKTRPKKQASIDDFDDDWFGSTTDTKKSTTNTTLKRQNDVGDDADLDDRWNRTSGSNTSYKPSFGGGGSTLDTTNF